MLLAVPFVIIFRFLKPWKLIRFGYFTVDRIGHFAFDVEYFLSERTLEVHPSQMVDLFFFEGRPANSQLKQMCKNLLFVSSIVRYLYMANQLIPGGETHRISPARHNTASRDKSGVFHKVPTQMCFTCEEDQRGSNYLSSVGCLDKNRLICLVVRDSAYLSQTQTGRDWSYHDFRDTRIEDYEDTILALAKKGYWVFRMGKVVGNPLTINHPRVIDYALTEHRSDFLDIWLMANCRFAISTGVGLDSVADIFRRPQVFVNYLPLIDMEAWGYYITVPKILIWSKSGRPLTFLEQAQHSSVNGHYYRENGIDVQDLSSNDITRVVLEMEARLAGTWKITEGDKRLHKDFWTQFRRMPNFSKYHGWIHDEARVGTYYLQNSNNMFV